MWRPRLNDEAVELAFKCLPMITDDPDNFTNYIGSSIIASHISHEVRELFMGAALTG